MALNEDIARHVINQILGPNGRPLGMGGTPSATNAAQEMILPGATAAANGGAVANGAGVMSSAAPVIGSNGVAAAANGAMNGAPAAAGAARQLLPNIGATGEGMAALPYAAEGGAAAGGASGLLARAAAAAGGGAAGAEGTGLLASMGGLGAVARAGGYGIAGQVGGGLLRGAIGNRDGTVDDAAVDAVKGAGLGAGIGSLIPIPGVGTLTGALIGGGLGGAYGAIFGGGSDASAASKAAHQARGDISDLLARYGASPQLAHETRVMLGIGLAGAKTAKDAEAVKEQVMANLPAALLQDEQTKQHASTAATIQAFLAPMMADQLNKSNLYAQQWSDTMAGAAKGISNGPLRDAYTASARQVPLDQATQNAYALQQMMLTPSLYGYQTDSSMNNQALLQMLGATSTGGGGNAGMLAMAGAGGAGGSASSVDPSTGLPAA